MSPLIREEQNQPEGAEQAEITEEDRAAVEEVGTPEITDERPDDLEWNLETQVIPETWDRIRPALLEAQETLGEDYSEAIEELHDLIWDRHPENDRGEFRVRGKVERKSAEKAIKEVFNEDQYEEIFRDYRHGYREALVIVNERLKFADSLEDEEESQKIRKQTLDIVSYLAAEEDDLEAFEDSFTSEQREALDEFRGELRVSSVEFAGSFVNENYESFEEERFYQELNHVRKFREKRRNAFIKEFWDTSEGSSAWEQESARTEREVSVEQEEEQEQEEFEPKSEAEYKRKFLRGLRDWDQKVREDGGKVINTQGFDPRWREQRDQSPGFLGLRFGREVKAPQVLFMQKQYVVVPAGLSGRNKERLVQVNVSCSTFSEVKSMQARRGLIGESSTDEGYYPQTIYSFDSQANSIVKAQELLWQLESHKVTKGFYMIPVLRGREGDKKACWLPLTKKQYKEWHKHLSKTVRNFESAGFTYAGLKNLHEREAFEQKQASPETEETEGTETVTAELQLNQLEGNVEHSWLLGHLQLNSIEEGYEVFEELELEGDEKSRQDSIEHRIQQEYLQFLAVYGRKSEYIRIARENLTSRGEDPEDPLLLRNEVDKLVRLIEVNKNLLTYLVSKNLELLDHVENEVDYLKEHPEEISEKLDALESSFDEYRAQLHEYHKIEEEAPEREEVTTIV